MQQGGQEPLGWRGRTREGEKETRQT